MAEVTLFGIDIKGDMVEKDDFVSIIAGKGMGARGWVRQKNGRTVFIELENEKMVENECVNLRVESKAPKVLYG